MSISAIITGGASGIGLATVELLHEGGARLAVVDANPDALALASGRINSNRAVFICADLAVEEEVESAVRQAVQHCGALNAVVNSAGIQRYGTAEQTSLALWHEVLNVNLTSAFLVARAAIPYLRQSGGGAIVNVGSVQSHAAQASAAAYVTSKHALLGLTRALAIDHAVEGIRVNCVCPGTVDTPMFRWTMEQDADPDAVLNACVAMHPLGRIARAEEVAAVIAFLLGDGASFMTGTAINVDGGLLALLGGAPQVA